MNINNSIIGVDNVCAIYYQIDTYTAYARKRYFTYSIFLVGYIIRMRARIIAVGFRVLEFNVP